MRAWTAVPNVLSRLADCLDLDGLPVNKLTDAARERGGPCKPGDQSYGKATVLKGDCEARCTPFSRRRLTLNVPPRYLLLRAGVLIEHDSDSGLV